MLGVVALGLVGAAYTLWYDNLTMTTNVTTGTLNADWSVHNWTKGSGFASTAATDGVANGQPIVHVANEDEAILNGNVASVLSGGLLGGKTTTDSWNKFTNANFPVGKPQPECTATGGNSNTLVFNMNKLYPYAGCEFQLDLHSTGTVPFHIAVTEVKTQQWVNGGWQDVVDPPWTRGFPSTDGQGNYYGDGPENQCFSFFNADWKLPLGQINLGNTADGAPIQVHPDQDLLCDFKLVLDENWKFQDGSSTDAANYKSNQGLSFRTIVKYTAYQWNEQPSAATLATID